MEWVLLWGMFGFGTIMVTVAVLLLGIGGRLPGTRERSRVQAGFPVERVAPPLSTRAPGPES